MEEDLKRKKKRTYKEAPPKSKAAKFFTSFFITLAIFLSIFGFLIAYKNSMSLGFGKDCEIFAVINDGDDVGVTLMNDHYVIKSDVMDCSKDVLKKIKLTFSYLEPAPSRMISRVVDKSFSYANSTADKYFSEIDFIAD